jgi:hypothetical protein
VSSVSSSCRVEESLKFILCQFYSLLEQKNVYVCCVYLETYIVIPVAYEKSYYVSTFVEDRSFHRN